MRLEPALVGLLIYLIIAAVIVVKRGKKQHNLAIPTAAGLLCFLVFVVVNLLDWPGAVLSTFWADHAIVSATASTIPLAGAGFFAFKVYDASIQAELDEKIAATGRSGLVDHLVDVDVALAMLPWADAKIAEWMSGDESKKPLRWLREKRGDLGPQQSDDPRHVSGSARFRWGDLQDELVDESIRRVMAGIRDWGPVLARSRAGEHDLIDLGGIRLELLAVRQHNGHDEAQIASLQEKCRDLAWCFENSSSPARNRQEVLVRTDGCRHHSRHDRKAPQGRPGQPEALVEERQPESVGQG